MRKTLKRGAAFCLAAMMALTACGAKSGNSGETGGQAAETKAQTQAEEKTEVRHLTLAAVASSSGLFPYCVSIGKVLSTLPELDITVSESGGNVDNTQQLRAGEISIANSISNTDYESYTGTGSTFKEPFKDFRILWYYESSPIQIDPNRLVLLDAYAVKGLRPGQQVYLHAKDHLNPTYEYGVTFERGVRVRYGDRSHILLSGTASIDNRGEIVAPQDIEGQTVRMLENVEALLAEAGASAADLAQMIVYLRDPADYPVVRKIFELRYEAVPRLFVHAPVCRPGWLIETECIAVREDENPAFAPL